MSQGLPYTYVDSKLHERRERVFLIFAGIFLGSMTMLNILGVTKFIAFVSWDAEGNMNWGQWGDITLAVAIGVLPYPITFLCTDFISEFYGRRRANFVVLVGVILNLWVIFILWLGGELPPVPTMDSETGLPAETDDAYAFYKIRMLTMGAVLASMCAYLAAQFCDVYLFHFWKKVTRGKHLWLRNNGSTMISQFVDTFAVITITHFYAAALPVKSDTAIWPQLWIFILTGYVFKLVVAALDTIPFYIGVHYLSRYLKIDPAREHDADREESQPPPGR